MEKLNYTHTLRLYEKNNNRMSGYGLFSHESLVNLRIGQAIFENCKIDYYGKIRVKSAFKPYSVGQKFEIYVDKDARMIELKPLKTEI